MKLHVFVASTLPINFIDKFSKDADAVNIYLINHNHLGAYTYLRDKNCNIELISLPLGFFRHFFTLLIILLVIKIKKEKIIFFHECCWEIFDLLLNITNISSDFYPHVTLNSLKKLDSKKISFRNKSKLVLLVFNQVKKFTPYELQTDIFSKAVVWSCHDYPSKTRVHNYSEVWPAHYITKTINSKNILFVIGSELIENNELIDLYIRIGHLLVENGYIIYVKDHPNFESRLNIDCSSWAQLIDPNLPVEFLNDNFLCVVGCASTALANFKGKAISIIHMTKMGRGVISTRIEHLNALFNCDEIEYVHNEKMLLSFIRKLSNLTSDSSLPQ